MKFLILTALLLSGGGSLGPNYSETGVLAGRELSFGDGFWDYWSRLRISEAVGGIVSSLTAPRKSSATEVDAVVDLNQESITINGTKISNGTYYPKDQTGKQYTKLKGNWANYTFKIKINSSILIQSIDITIDETDDRKVDLVYINLGKTAEEIVHIDINIERTGKAIAKIPMGQDRQKKERLQQDLKAFEDRKQVIKNELNVSLTQYAKAILLFLKAYPNPNLGASLKKSLENKGGLREKFRNYLDTSNTTL